MNRIYGINSVRNSLRGQNVKKLYLLKNFSNKDIVNEARKQKLEVVYVDKKEMDAMMKDRVHQGVVAEVIDFKTYSLKEVMSEKQDSVLVILDELNDPHNLGAILRSADIFKAEGVIFKKDNQVPLNGVVAKVSTGAINFVKCCEVTNLTRTIKELKENGYWVVGLDGTAKLEVKDCFKDRKLAIVVGSEGYGISKLVRENCDLIVKIPQFGHINCLNASVACSIMLYEIRR